jgi:hypothetical protein
MNILVLLYGNTRAGDLHQRHLGVGAKRVFPLHPSLWQHIYVCCLVLVFYYNRSINNWRIYSAAWSQPDMSFYVGLLFFPLLSPKDKDTGIFNVSPLCWVSIKSYYCSSQAVIRLQSESFIRCCDCSILWAGMNFLFDWCCYLSSSEYIHLLQT